MTLKQLREILSTMPVPDDTRVLVRAPSWDELALLDCLTIEVHLERDGEADLVVLEGK